MWMAPALHLNMKRKGGAFEAALPA